MKRKKEERMDTLDRIVSPVFTVLTVISILPVIFILLNTTANVITRAFFKYSIFGSVTLSQVTLSLCVMCAMPVVTMYNTHIKVDLVVARFPAEVQKIFDYFGLVFCAAVQALLCWYSFVKAGTIMEQGTMTDSLNIPYWPVYGLIAVMFGAAALCAVYNIVHYAVAGTLVEPMTFSELRARLKARKNEA